jgi:hypothetical protein
VTDLFCAFVCVTAEVKDDPTLDRFDASLDKIEKLHEKGGCFFFRHCFQRFPFQFPRLFSP